MSSRYFLKINFIILLLNAGIGIYLNLDTLHIRSTTKDKLNLRNYSIEGLRNYTTESDIFPFENVAKEFGILDSHGNFTFHPFQWPAKSWIDIASNSQICLATQTSVDRLFWLSWQAESWSGPISVALFAPGSDLGVAIAMINYLRRCFPGMLERTSLHLAYPVDKPPYIADRQDDYSTLDCNSPEAVNRAFLSLRDGEQTANHNYPQNLLRNIARKTCGTAYSFTIDIDMLVIPSMADSLENFLSTGSGCQKCTYVVPAYEIHRTVDYPPNDKEELLALVKKKLARRFHVRVYDKNQGNSKLDKWEVSDKSNYSADNADDIPIYKVMYNITTYEEYWEPLLILPAMAPGFDERFIGYGFTRSSQVYELKLRNYSFGVLDKAFLSHRGFQTTANYPSYRKAQIMLNRDRYHAFKRELHARLNTSSKKAIATINKQNNSNTKTKGTTTKTLHMVNRKNGIVSIRALPPILQNLHD